MTRYNEIIIGILLGLVSFLIWRGVDLTPVCFIGGALLVLYLFTQGKLGRSFEVVANQAAARIDPGVCFDDIGGQEIAKRELLEALDFVCNLEKTTRLGIRPLKGILLTGPPGTGKTLLAKAAANYTGSVFVSASGSEFVEMYAGVGAQRVRQLFTKARQLAAKSHTENAVVFIDEIEVIAGKRGGHTSHLEYDQTLNQLLVEMDGLKPEESVRILIIAATNRADLLDGAILRPGRFDRQVKVDYPDKDGRLHILKIHAKGKPLAQEVDLEEIAKDTFGFSGAHLESLINEAAILAYRKKRVAIKMDDLREAIDKVLLGEKLERKVEMDELRRVAVHETGHALISEILKPESVAALTIMPRGKALGFMRQARPREQYLYTRDYLLDQIAICLGGAGAEELIYHNRSTGASNDFEQATGLCKQLIISGLSELGIIQEDLAGKDRLYETMKELLSEQEKRVRQILESHRDLLKQICEELMVKEKVTGEWFREKLKSV